MVKKSFIILLILLVLLGTYLYFTREKGGEKPSFRFALVEKGPVLKTVSASGTLNAVTTVKVGSQVSGQIMELMVDFNSVVKKDQVIARIDPANFEARVRQAEAELEISRANVSIQRAAVQKSQADHENAKSTLLASKSQTEKSSVAMADAKRDLDRKKRLYGNKIIPESDLDKAKATHDQARAQLKAVRAEGDAKASIVKTKEAIFMMAKEQVIHALAQVKHRKAVLNLMKIDLAHTIIRSPVEGVVIERNVDMGQTVAASLQAPTLFTIAKDLKRMQVDADIDEADIGSVRLGQNSTFTVDAFPDREFEGRVEQVRLAPHSVQNVVTYTVVITADNLENRLFPGMTANIKVVVDKRQDALKVPNRALRFRPRDRVEKSAPKGTSPGRGGGPPADPRERMKRLVQVLELDKEQQEQVREIFQGVRKKVMALRSQGIPMTEIQPQIKSYRQRARDEMVAILNPEQRGKFERIERGRASGIGRKGRVWLPGEDGIPKPVEVILGISDGNFTEVIRGDLREGQQIIIGRSKS